MRLTWALLLVIGCGEVSTAGPGEGGSSGGALAGSSGEAGTTGGAGTSGSAGTTGSAGTGGTAVAPSCAIPLEQINGTDMGALYQRSGNCTNQTAQRVQIVNGKVFNYFNADSWAVDNYSIALDPSTTSTCEVSLRYARTDSTCGSEHLFVTLAVPAI